MSKITIYDIDWDASPEERLEHKLPDTVELDSEMDYVDVFNFSPESVINTLEHRHGWTISDIDWEFED